MAGQQFDDARRCSAPADRNKDPILSILKRTLPQQGLVLEIASGTGQHVVHFAAALPALTWQPSDPDAASRASIRSWIEHAGLGNVREPLDLDVRRFPWPVKRVDALLAINMIHIAPWEATIALIDGAHQVLDSGGVLFLYGPYRRSGRHTAPSNAAFDAQLRATDPSWGVRDLEAVIELAGAAHFELSEIVEMPANNLSVVFCKVPAG